MFKVINLHVMSIYTYYSHAIFFGLDGNINDLPSSSCKTKHNLNGGFERAFSSTGDSFADFSGLPSDFTSVPLILVFQLNYIAYIWGRWQPLLIKQLP